MLIDIQNRDDIYTIIDNFYIKLLKDDVVQHFFDDILQKKHLQQHLETITDFWNGILFGATDYQRNAMQPHLILNTTIPFRREHFKRWLALFTSSVDENFKGEKAEIAKTRALSIATVMEIKIINATKSNL